ncbi:hypothetical protein [Mycolicibacterium palauense]|uniref:hypothetical protein n=1 Tax=Mycolicibacterium palauense TaxID=2034511 RepID=UPI0011460271|nr:hypothetical protein [Mycolicibacterium palauense]
MSTTARSGLRVERNRWAAPFTRRLARRLVLSAPRGLPDLDALIHDGDQKQWASVRISNGLAAVTDGVGSIDDVDVRDTVAIDFPRGIENYGGIAEDKRAALSRAVECPNELDWVAELDDFWRQHGKSPGMPGSLHVRDHQGRTHVVGRADTAFEVHGDGAVLGRVFSGDMLFDEALFSHLLRIVGGLAEVSGLIGATMREAYGGFEV